MHKKKSYEKPLKSKKENRFLKDMKNLPFMIGLYFLRLKTFIFIYLNQTVT